MQHKEFIIYIHGVEPHEEGHSHQVKYEILHQGIYNQLENDDRHSAWKEASVCMTEWGWQAPGSGSLGSHKRLTEAQQQLGEKIMGEIEKHHWLPIDLQLIFSPLNALRICRYLLLHFYGRKALYSCGRLKANCR